MAESIFDTDLFKIRKEEAQLFNSNISTSDIQQAGNTNIDLTNNISTTPIDQSISNIQNIGQQRTDTTGLKNIDVGLDQNALGIQQAGTAQTDLSGLKQYDSGLDTSSQRLRDVGGMRTDVSGLQNFQPTTQQSIDSLRNLTTQVDLSKLEQIDPGLTKDVELLRGFTDKNTNLTGLRGVQTSQEESAKKIEEIGKNGITGEGLERIRSLRPDNEFERDLQRAIELVGDTAEGRSKVDDIIANRLLNRFDATQAASRIAQAQQIAANPLLSEGAKAAAMAESRRRSGIERSELVGQLSQQAQERAFQAQRSYADLAQQASMYNEQKFQNDINTLTNELNTKLNSAINAANIRSRGTEFELNKQSQIANYMQNDLNRQLQAQIAAGQLSSTEAELVLDSVNSLMANRQQNIQNSLEAEVAAGNLSSQQSAQLLEKFTNLAKFSADDLNRELQSEVAAGNIDTAQAELLLNKLTKVAEFDEAGLTRALEAQVAAGQLSARGKELILQQQRDLAQLSADDLNRELQSEIASGDLASNKANLALKEWQTTIDAKLTEARNSLEAAIAIGEIDRDVAALEWNKVSTMLDNEMDKERLNLERQRLAEDDKLKQVQMEQMQQEMELINLNTWKNSATDYLFDNFINQDGTKRSIDDWVNDPLAVQQFGSYYKNLPGVDEEFDPANNSEHKSWLESFTSQAKTPSEIKKAEWRTTDWYQNTLDPLTGRPTQETEQLEEAISILSQVGDFGGIFPITNEDGSVSFYDTQGQMTMKIDETGNPMEITEKGELVSVTKSKVVEEEKDTPDSVGGKITDFFKGIGEKFATGNEEIEQQKQEITSNIKTEYGTDFDIPDNVSVGDILISKDGTSVIEIEDGGNIKDIVYEPSTDAFGFYGDQIIEAGINDPNRRGELFDQTMNSRIDSLLNDKNSREATDLRTTILSSGKDSIYYESLMNDPGTPEISGKTYDRGSKVWRISGGEGKNAGDFIKYNGNLYLIDSVSTEERKEKGVDHDGYTYHMTDVTTGDKVKYGAGPNKGSSGKSTAGLFNTIVPENTSF